MRFPRASEVALSLRQSRLPFSYVGKGDRSKLKDLDQAHFESLTGKQDAAHCKQGNKTQTEYRVGTNGNVGNVFVWIQPDEGSFFQVPEDQVKSAAKKIEMGQPSC